jgi:hypothetical protein
MENEKFVVLKSHNFKFEAEASEFSDAEEASEYLCRFWAGYLAEELLESRDSIDLSQSYCDSDYGVVTWKDGYKTEFRLIDLTPPRKEYSRK